MKPYGRVWRVLSLLGIFALSSILIQVPLIMPVDATQGTWVIENETVAIENTDLVHEGDIVIRGTGQLSLLNGSLTIVQLLSWQFQIQIEDSGVLFIEDSELRSKYPFKIECNGNSEINMTSSSCTNAKMNLNDDCLGSCTDSSLFGITANGRSQTSIDSCILRIVTSNDEASIVVNGSEIGSVGINDNSQVNITTSHIGPVVVESCKPVNLKDCAADALRGWGESKITVSGCSLGDYRYSDHVEATISNSSIGDLDATGTSPLTLNQIEIGSAILRGSANVTMIDCTVGTIEVYLYSAITLWNSTCGNFFSTEYADVKILGDSTAMSYLDDCIITQMSTAIIIWSNFDYLEISHSSTAQVNDSYAGYFSTWRYTTCIIDIWRCRFHELRSGSKVSMHDTSVEIWSNIGDDFTAISCDFGADVTFYGSSTGYFENCTMNPLRPQYESQVVIRNCTTRVAILDYANRLRSVDSVPAGDILYWNSDASNALANVQWNLTVYDSRLTGWDIAFRFEESYTVMNSTLQRVTVSAQCSVAMENSSIEHLVVTNGDTRVYQSELVTIEVQQSAQLILNESVCDVIRHYHDARSTHYNSTFDQFLSGTQAECHLFDCEISYLGHSGSSRIYLDNCTLTNLDSSEYAITELVDSEVKSRLGIHHFTVTSVFNSSIGLLSGYQTSQIGLSACTISDILLLESSVAFVSDSSIVSFHCIGTSVLTISGNLSDTITSIIENSAQIFREFHFAVEDQLGNPIQSATVEISDSLGNPIISGITNLEGHCNLSVVFEISGLGFLSTFSVVVRYSGFNITNGLLTTTPQPIVLVIDLSGPSYASNLDLVQTDESSDQDNYALTSQSLNRSNIIEFVIYSLCLVSLSLFKTPEGRRPSTRESSLAKLRLVKQEDVKK
jgi:hypothetical protein